MRAMACLICLAACCQPGHADPVKVSVLTTDGNSFSGALDLESVRLRTASGDVDVPVADLSSIEFKGAEAVIRRRDGSTVKGSPATAKWRISTERLGVLELKSEVLLRITVESPVQKEPPGVLAVPVLGHWSGSIALLRALAATSDGKGVWALDGRANKLIRFSLDPLKPVSEIPFDQKISDWSPSPDARFAVVVSGKRITALDLERGVPTGSWDLPESPRGVLMIDGGTVALSTGSTGVPATSLRTLPGIAELVCIPRTGGPPRLIPGTPEILTPGGRIRLTRPLGGGNPRVEWLQGSEPDPASTGELVPVGPRHDIDRFNGRVLERSRSHRARPLEAGRFEAPASGIVPISETGQALVFTDSGKALLLQIEPYKVLVERSVGNVVWSAVVEPSREAMVVFALDRQASAEPNGSRPGTVYRLSFPR